MNATIEMLLRRWLRYRLRIATTVLCLIACGLLIKLWISSYHSSHWMRAVGERLTILSWKGVFTVNPGSTTVGTATQQVEFFHLPHWSMVLLFATLAALPWVRWSSRYSIRALLAITALIALLLMAIAVSH